MNKKIFPEINWGWGLLACSSKVSTGIERTGKLKKRNSSLQTKIFDDTRAGGISDACLSCTLAYTLHQGLQLVVVNWSTQHHVDRYAFLVVRLKAVILHMVTGRSRWQIDPVCICQWCRFSGVSDKAPYANDSWPGHGVYRWEWCKCKHE